MRHAKSNAFVACEIGCDGHDSICAVAIRFFSLCTTVLQATLFACLSILQRNALLEMQQEDLLIVSALYMRKKKKENRKQKHRWWVHDILKRRDEQGAYQHLVRELRDDGEKFRQYFCDMWERPFT